MGWMFGSRITTVRSGLLESCKCAPELIPDGQAAGYAARNVTSHVQCCGVSQGVQESDQRLDVLFFQFDRVQFICIRNGVSAMTVIHHDKVDCIEIRAGRQNGLFLIIIMQRIHAIYFVPDHGFKRIVGSCMAIGW